MKQTKRAYASSVVLVLVVSLSFDAKLEVGKRAYGSSATAAKKSQLKVH